MFLGRHMRLLASLLVASLVACGGGGSSKPSTPTGVWDGMYGYGSSDPDTAFQIALLPDGSARTREGNTLSTLGTGTWSRTGDTVTMSYAITGGGTTYDVEATIGSGSLTGTWGEAPSASDEGRVAFDKFETAGGGAWIGNSSGTNSGEVLMIAWPGGGFEFWDTAALSGTRGSGTWTLTGGLFDAVFTYKATTCEYSASLSGSAMGGTLTSNGVYFPGSITNVQRVE